MENCRLCGSACEKFYVNKVLNKYEVEYQRCQNCESLQTQEPYWLDEAYSSNLSMLDTNVVQRNIQNMTACYFICKIFNLKNALDFGGGEGLLCRMLRDFKINCFVDDKYAKPTFAQGFDKPNFTQPDLVTAFEVLEHFPNPAADLHKLFDKNPKCVFVSTVLFKGQSRDWWYLSSDTGQHIFFYSKKAMQNIANKFDYQIVLSDAYCLFYKSGKKLFFKQFFTTLVMNKYICRMLRSIVAVLPTPGVALDTNELRRKI